MLSCCHLATTSDTQVTSEVLYFRDSKSVKTPPEEYTSINLV